MSYIDKMQVGEETYEIKDSSAARASDIATLETAIAGKQDNLNQAQLTAVNSGIDSTKVGQIATNTNDIDAIEGKIPAQATSSNQLADKDFVNSSVATNTAYYISDNGEPFDSLADLEAYSGTLTNNDYAFVVGTDAAGNTTYTRYKYNADTETWAEEYVLNNSSFTAEQWATINSGITSGDVTKLSGLANIKTIGSNLSLDSNGELSATDTTYTNFTGTDGTTAGAAGLVPAPATTDADKYLKSDGTWNTVPAGPTIVQTTGTSTTDVMSQNAVTGMVFKKTTTTEGGSDTIVVIGQNAAAATAGNPTNTVIGTNARGGTNTNQVGNTVVGAFASTGSNVGGTAIGHNANAMASHGVAVGRNSSANFTGAIALGASSLATAKGQMNIGTTSTSFGYNDSNYRLLTGLYDGQSAHDAATVGQLPAVLINSQFNQILEAA